MVNEIHGRSSIAERVIGFRRVVFARSLTSIACCFCCCAAKRRRKQDEKDHEKREEKRGEKDLVKDEEQTKQADGKCRGGIGRFVFLIADAIHAVSA